MAFSANTANIGARPVPIRTESGRLVIYHGAQTTYTGFIYSIGVALLDWVDRYPAES
jgi:predicted GH43/DUF377 family glycosyl hydrolase